MNLAKRSIYSLVVQSLGLYQRLFLDVHVWGRENLSPGPKIFVGNHITSHDAFYVLPHLGEVIHFIIGPGYQSPLAAKLLDAFEQINALADDGKTVVAQAVEMLRKGESICVTPEGNIQKPFQLGRFLPGVARIYRECSVPIIPIGVAAPRHALREYPKRSAVIGGQIYPFIVVKRGTYCISLGEPWMPDCPAGSDAKQILYITRGLRERIQLLVDDVRQNKFWL